MNVLIFESPDEATKAAFDIVMQRLETGLQTMGLATGSTPLKLYEKLRNTDTDVSHVTTVNLDEYVGLEPTDPQSYNYYMNEELFKYMNFAATYVPNGAVEDPEKECERYEEILKKNPVDLQILGMGPNGHIGFNEPGTSFDSVTHIAELTASTREANKRFFEKEEQVPTKAITMGISSILSAKEVLMLAFGESKAEAVRSMIDEPVTEGCPASVLQNHSNAVIILDKEAASKLERSK
ncbi:glucosamine-6-phosphate deaminase [Siminovitchia terrae]|uniref:Glucosamine-6-phosphate deaminase n=1 Tax=Siminovitchia terrae TaxID=1914933 RepID=A0A429XDE2_SIMTE|nr:glucosamine-6-phosphate deaminase [Siminovitchia terrae]RST61013.1 glucosamine-6-phosphate deaminase [Siminovitchia terrae]GIN90877.1 glucosamine-6-phosphate deaminase [Siminovitchia terrae]GIN97652.1 glucosamine-6-phosphate deaminase [Siminovitchia terrae]